MKPNSNWSTSDRKTSKLDANMADVTKKKRIRAGHRSSATRMLTQVEESLAASPPGVARLSQLKLSLQEKLETLKLLDGEIVDLTEESHLADEIEQADGFKEHIYAAMVRIESDDRPSHLRVGSKRC